MDSKYRNLIYIIIAIICIIAIIIAVYYQFFAKKVVNKNKVNQITNSEEIIEPEPEADDPADLLSEFNKLFTNTFEDQGFNTDNIQKIEGLEKQDIVYKQFDIVDTKEVKYEMNIKIPVINIASDVVTKFNETTQSVFVDKASGILIDTNEYTIYNIEFTSYLNDNLLSVMIKGTLKEGDKPQRVFVQTYNYDIETGKSVTLDEVLESLDYKKDEVNNKIMLQVKEAKKQADAISGAVEQTIYKRDLDNAMYVTENVKNFFMGKNGQIYIIYAYGNNNSTSEIDIIKI